MTMSFTRLLLAATSITLMATACGGGGGSGSTASTPAPPPAPEPEPVPPPTELFSLSGTISASGSQAVDSDNNDPYRTAISNDTADTAQLIPNPVTLGGYVNEPGTGAEGRSQQSGDTADFFQVELLQGQRVTMLVADFNQADADLYLQDTLGKNIAVSIELGEVESVLAPADGTYFVKIEAFTGATNYTLAIGGSNSFVQEMTGQQSAVHHSLIPWQTVVKYRGEKEAGDDTDEAPADINYRLGLEQRAGGRGRGRLMTLRRDLMPLSRRGRRAARLPANEEQFADPDLQARWETLLTIKYLNKDPQVEYAQPNYQVRAMLAPDDEAYPFQWHYPLISLPQAWDTTSGNPETIVAVIDTGILSGHPDLAGQLVSGYDFIRDPASSLDGDGIDPDPQDPGDTLGAGSGNFHGSHVSGTVAARTNNNRGVAGVAYSARIMPLRALGAGGGGTSYDLEQAIRFAAALPNDSGTVPDRPADIINLSLGGAPFIQATQDLFNEVRAAGILVVASAGNEASSIPGYPASYTGVISVSAVDAQRRLAPYSNTGTAIDIAAPGGNNGEDFNGDGYPDGVLSTGGSVSAGVLKYEYVFLAGTSMAAPHVAGVLALMKSVNPALTPQDIDVLLQTGQLSDDLGATGRDNLYGHGLVNAQRAVLAALEASGSTPADNPRLVASSSTLNFASTATTLELVLDNGGKGDLELLELSSSEPWLSLTGLDLDEGGLGTYQVTVDRSALDPGVYSANIHAQSSINALDVRVFASAGDQAASADVGLVYILLYEPGADTAVAQSDATASDGKYVYEFLGIAPGQYEIIAGSDADNDLLICDPGEACGAWLTLDQPILLDLFEDTSDVDFPIEYQVSLPSLINSAAGDKQDPKAASIPPGNARGIAKTRLQTDD